MPGSPERPVGERPLSLVMTAKPLAHAKSRLGVDEAGRARWARDMLAHVVDTALGAASVGGVVVVTADPDLADLVAHRTGVTVLRTATDPGLRPSLATGRDVARRRTPGAPVGLLVTDLPLLRAEDLDAVAVQLPAAPAAAAGLFVADHLGTGTTMLLHRAGAASPILFGDDSAAAHARAGYVPATGELTGLRQDLDDAEDLRTVESGRVRADGSGISRDG
ncbi:NTP transferase domain-containing protein [Nocardioidaceae bacterium]|nr:NTP transferase domain-containing protein [Nocardioidaceae bacterium]